MQSTGQQPAVPPAKRAAPPTPPIPPEFKADAVITLDPPKLVQVLKDPGATVFQKAKACQRLAVVGGKEAVPALAALLADPKLAHYARFGLEPIPDPSADDALREALKKVTGGLLVGVINSIGHRRDPKAVDALAKLLHGADAEVALAAAAALGRISGPAAAKALQDGLAKTKGAVRTAVAGAGLVCAEGLLAQGDRKQALALYGVLSRPDIPKSVRLAAMHSTIAAETSLTRPR
jgi:HEAT repeat protein